MSLPRAEAAPVSGASSPTLMGPAWARAADGALSAAPRPVSSAASVRSTSARRVMTVLLYSVTLAAKRTGQPAGGEEDDADIDGAQDEQPPLGVHADEVLEENDEGSADGGARERAGPPQGDHQKRLDRGDQLDIHGAHEAVVVGPEHAGQAGEGP